MTSLTIGGIEVLPMSQINIDLPVARLHTHTELTMPVRVVRGSATGPRLFVTAAVHGDEINGVEIIRRVLKHSALRKLHGTLILVPVVNVFAFIEHSRYLPDRRDLNRSFPGSERGSLAARLAHRLMQEIAGSSTHGIDLHTGAVQRPNYPQVRIGGTNQEVLALARAFGAPVILHGDEPPEGSLRRAVSDKGIPVLTYEGGCALRFDEGAIRAGVVGILRVMHALRMIEAVPATAKKKGRGVLSRNSAWVRAPQSGLLRHALKLGARCNAGDTLGIIGGPFGDNEVVVTAPCTGIVIGCLDLPLVNEGDALFHIAEIGGSHSLLPSVAPPIEEELAPPLRPSQA